MLLNNNFSTGKAMLSLQDKSKTDHLTESVSAHKIWYQYMSFAVIVKYAYIIS